MVSRPVARPLTLAHPNGPCRNPKHPQTTGRRSCIAVITKRRPTVSEPTRTRSGPPARPSQTRPRQHRPEATRTRKVSRSFADVVYPRCRRISTLCRPRRPHNVTQMFAVTPLGPERLCARQPRARPLAENPGARKDDLPLAPLQSALSKARGRGSRRASSIWPAHGRPQPTLASPSPAVFPHVPRRRLHARCALPRASRPPRPGAWLCGRRRTRGDRQQLVTAPQSAFVI